MKRLLLTLALLFAPSLAFAQCNGVFPNNTVCGNATGSSNVPRATAPGAFTVGPAGTNGQVQYNNNGAFGGFTIGSGLPVFGNGAGSPGMVAGTRSGNTTEVATVTGSLTSGHCAKWDASGNLVDNGAPCGAATPASFGAACNVTQVTGNTSIASGAATLTVVGASFTSNDVGKIISIPGAGPTVNSIATSLNTTISVFTDATHVTVANNASNTLSAVSKTVTYGTDDTSAFQTLFDSTASYTVDLTLTSSTKGCMFGSALTLSLPKRITGNGPSDLLFFRQQGTSTGANFITLNAAAANAILENFGIDFDIGGRVSSSGITIEYNASATNVVVRRVAFEGNIATAGYTSTVMDNIPNETQLIDNYIHGYNGYIFRAASKASNVLIDGNRIVNGPKNSVGYGIAFLSSGQTGAMGGLRIVNNNIDFSNLATADQTVGIYVFGGDTTRANSYNNVVIANNLLVGTSGTTTTISAGVLVTQAYNVVIANNSIKFFGEGIGTGNVVNDTISNNSLYGNGTYSIESNGDTGVAIVGNTAQSDGFSSFGITCENMINGVIAGNTVDGTASAAAYNGITVIGVNSATGVSTFKVTITGNTVILPSSGTGKAILIQCNVGATSCLTFVISSNVLDNASTIGTGSTGVFINHGAGTTMGNFQIGPNYSRLDTGVFIDTGVTGNCYITGKNNSNTPITNNGSASSCL